MASRTFPRWTEEERAKTLAFREKARKWNKQQRQAEYSRKRHARLMATDAGYVMEVRLRRRMKSAMTCKKAGKFWDLVGCTAGELREHIESQFKSGMCWGNRHLWHIDHIRPCASFDMSDPAQQAQCFHYLNLQPLWADENLKKGDSWEPPVDVPALAS